MLHKIRFWVNLYIESLIFAYQALKLNKIRAFLSLIGITIGIFSIISVFTVLDGIRTTIETSIQSLGNNILYIQKWPWEFSNDYPWWKYLSRPVTKVNEAREIALRSKYASYVVFTAKTIKSIIGGKIEVKNVPIVIADYDFDKVRTFEIQKGRYFSTLEASTGMKKAIIGHQLANILFKNDNPIGKTIEIQGQQFTVIGVFKKEGSSVIDESVDKMVLLPLKSCLSIFNLEDDNMNPTIIVKSKNKVSLEILSNELKVIMRSIRRIRPSEEDNFAINQASSITEVFKNLFSVVDMAGIIIGGFSILVGGFGIANIMFVSVKERTKIIGIQKSIGARNEFILFQFLNEAILLSLIGGMAGLLLVLFGMFYSQKIIDLNLSLSLSNIILALSLSSIIGLTSGLAPALAASKINPVNAINTNF